MDTWGSFEVFTLLDPIMKLMPEGINNFQEWSDSLTSGKFADYYIICNKENLDKEEVKYIRNMALSIFFKENNIDEMPLVEEFIEDIVSEFINCIILVGMQRQSKVQVDGPIILKDQMLRCTKVNAYSL